MTDEQRHIVKNVLIDAWVQAEGNDDEEVVEAVKQALDDLDMAYVRD